jgi:hypothetical protein
LHDIGFYFCLDYHCEPADDGSTIESRKESALLSLQESIDDYVKHLSPDEARVLQVSGSANEPPANAHKKINKDTGNNNKKRKHELHSLIKKIFTSLNSTRNNNDDVWNALKSDASIVGQKKKYDKEEIIQEIKRGAIFWTTKRGTERRMLRRTFDNYLSKLRNP